MKLYLETNAIRKLSSHLNQIKRSYPGCFTSSLTVVELLTGIDKKDYFVRKQAMKNTFMSGIDIIWDLPEKKVADSFTCMNIDEYRASDLKMLAVIFSECESKEEMNNLIKKTNLKFDFEYFINSQQSWRNTFIKGHLMRKDSVKKLFESDNREGFIFHPPDSILNRKEYYTLWNDKHFRFNFWFTVLSLAETFCDENLPTDEFEKQADVIYNSYNGSINNYVAAYSYYDIEKISTLDIAERNDVFDLQHFLYTDKDTTIVSNDMLILKICDKLKIKAIQPQELLTQVN